MLFCERNQKLRKFVGLGFRGFGLECLEGVCASRRELAMDGKRRALVAAILGAGVIAGSVVAVLVRSWHALGVPWRWQGLWLLLCYASCASHYHATVSTFFVFQFESNAETILHVYAGLKKLRSIGVEEVRVVGL
jgi:hypothetical protein